MNQRRGARYVDPSVQGGIVLRMLFYWTTFFVVGLVISFAVQVLCNPLEPMNQHLASVWQNQGPFILAAFCLLPIYTYDLIRFSHRFVGPIIRFRRVVNEAADGEVPPPFNLRDKDYWKEFASDLNRLFDRMRGGRSPQES
ncbi:hypothetical protein LOC68_20345 [Blastopirellula sp. JC732]|uniref:HAMP domain-containing protein n=1 Tax=Blastopirellula sediminis TaxID=2894196 RepID=A0A9X1MQU0_9BACT|nr:hypothetical protein [Blastopirellula sediminis]MCC9605949.1 hypothetical protein [Blastopirellula sediminis]MCC9630752.1 hypothetical protein [Blastopirellula sediminis]